MGVSEHFSTMSFLEIFLTLTILFCVQSEELEERGLEPTIMCGKSTHKIIEVGKKTMSVFQTQMLTRRCTLVYKLTGGCNQSSLTCGSFFQIKIRKSAEEATECTSDLPELNQEPTAIAPNQPGTFPLFHKGEI